MVIDNTALRTTSQATGDVAASEGHCESDYNKDPDDYNPPSEGKCRLCDYSGSLSYELCPPCLVKAETLLEAIFGKSPTEGQEE